jgi:hypothetical protein
MRFSFLLAISAWSPGGDPADPGEVTADRARLVDPTEPIQGIERLLEVMM